MDLEAIQEIINYLLKGVILIFRMAIKVIENSPYICLKIWPQDAS